MKTLNSANFVLLDKHKEANHSPSETVPGEAMSVQELLMRHQDGTLGNALQRQGIYLGEDNGDGGDVDFDDPDYEKLATSDLFDQEQFAKGVKSDLDEVNKQYAEENRKKAAAQTDEYYRKKYARQPDPDEDETSRKPKRKPSKGVSDEGASDD